MPAIPDHLAALRTFLISDAGVAAATGGAGSGSRVFAGQLPEKFVASGLMPTGAVLITAAGGLGTFGGGYQQFGDRRVDVRSYGASPHSANDLWRVVHPALKNLARELIGDPACLLHWARPAGGPLPLRDPDKDWPFVLSTWQVLSAEVAPA